MSRSRHQARPPANAPQGPDPFASGRVVIADGWARFGTRRLGLADVRGWRIDSEPKGGLIGNIASFALFGIIAIVILQGMLGTVFPPRTLVAVGTLALVALIGLQDVWLERGHGFYRLLVRTGAGEEMVFATSVRAEVELVAARLQAALAARSVEPAESTCSTSARA